MKIQAADGPAIVTVPNVAIVSTGTYKLAGNPYPNEDGTTFTEADLTAAVAASEDPTTQLPRLKLGHTSEWGDAEPAFGKVDNLRVGDNGQTLYGDFVGVPAWLADVLPAVYPSRSLEAYFNVTAASGRTYDMCITAVALLGVVLPGVGSLEDLAGLYTETMPEGVQVNAEATRITAQIGGDLGLLRRRTESSVPLEDVRRSYYDQLNGEQMFWWIRAVMYDPNELIVDDDEGGLYRVPFDVKGEEVTFGDPVGVKVEYVDASDAREPQLIYASRGESRPETKEGEVDGALATAIRSHLNLPESATDEEVTAAMAEAEAPEGTPPPTPAPTAPEGAPPAEPPEGDTEDDDDEDDESTSDETPEAEGTTSVDRGTLTQLQRDAAAGRAAREQQLTDERERELTAAVGDGKFPPARKDHWRKSWIADPEGTKAAIDALEPGLIPVAEAGSVPSETESAQAYDPSWLSSGERAKIAAGNNGGVEPGTITTEAI